MFRYNNNHIFTGYLKQFLSSFNLPTCKIYTDEFAKYREQRGEEDPRVLESFDTIFRGSGEDANSIRTAVRINYLKNNELYNYFWSTSNGKSWKRSSDVFYSSDKAVHGLTRSLNSPGNQYDTITHEYLGEYLRFLRDYHNINLMSMYNCFNDKIYNNVYFNFVLANDSSVTFNAKDPAYRIYAIPVKLFSEYTIAIDCSQGIELFCGLYNTSLEVSGQAGKLAAKTYMKVNKTLFNQPFLYNKLNIDNWSAADDFTTSARGQLNLTQIHTDTFTRWDLANREKDLRLFIKVPTSCKSSITILEGDYRVFNAAKHASAVNVKYDEVGRTIWTYDTTLKTFKTRIGGEEYVLGISNDSTFTGVSPIKASADPYYVQFVTDKAELASGAITNAVQPIVGDTYKYKLALYHSNNEKVYYLDGNVLSNCYTDGNMTSKYHFASTENAENGINVFIENTGSGYYLAYTINNITKYINVSPGAVYQNNHSVLNFKGVDLNNYSFKPISKLQLLALNTGESYPFADRLVEYLSGSAITPIDEIPDNIKRAQRVMEQNKNYFYIEGLWEPKMQNILYDYMMSSGPIVATNDGKLLDKRTGVHPRLGFTSKSTLYDVLGYVDKDAEKWYASWINENNAARVKDSIQNVDIYVDNNGKSLWDI
jgi:hypothetical protein